METNPAASLAMWDQGYQLSGTPLATLLQNSNGQRFDSIQQLPPRRDAATEDPSITTYQRQHLNEHFAQEPGPSQGQGQGHDLSQASLAGRTSLEQWIKGHHMNNGTLQALLAGGCDNMATLQALGKDDLATLGLPIGQLRMLEKALGFTKVASSEPLSVPSGASVVDTPQPATVNPQAQVHHGKQTLQLDRNQGKTSHYDITDFLPQSIEMQEEIKVLSGEAGHPELVLRSGPQKAKIRKSYSCTMELCKYVYYV